MCQVLLSNYYKGSKQTAFQRNLVKAAETKCHYVLIVFTKYSYTASDSLLSSDIHFGLSIFSPHSFLQGAERFLSGGNFRVKEFFCPFLIIQLEHFCLMGSTEHNYISI